ncbi:hypothetical protein ACFLQQ_04160 [Actinomycetota bacterium]
MGKLKIGFMPVVLGLYTSLVDNLEERYDKRVIKPVIKRLKEFGEVVYPGIVLDIDRGKKAKAKFLKNDVDIIIVLNLSYTTSEIPFSVLRGMNKPLIVLNSQVRKTVDKDFKIVNLAEEHCLVGTTELTSILKRINYPQYYIVSGLIDKDSTYRKLAQYLDAVRVIKILQNSNIGFIGNTVYTGMLDIEVDETLVKNKFGLNIIHLSQTEIANTFRSVEQKEIESEEKKISGKYKNIDLTKKQFDVSVRMGLTYKKLIDKYGLSSVANYCQSTMYNPDIGLPPCLGTTMCMSSGTPFSCEGDVGNAISLLIVKELTGNSTFSETYMLDYDKNAVLLGHCGQGNFNFAHSDDEVFIAKHTAFDDTKHKAASSNFSYKDGKAVLCNMSTDSGCRWKMVISSGEVKHLPPTSLGLPQAWYDPGMELDEFVEKWCGSGPSHHGALGYGDISKTLARIGDMLDLNVYMVE